MFMIVLFLFFAADAKALQLYNVGSTHDIVTTTSQLICLAGGGDDDLWSDGWKQLLQASGGGDIVIIRADGDRGGYENWIYNDEGHHQFVKVNSVKTIVIENASDANRGEVINLISKAELIFFAGGDQSRYINWFRHSKLAAAVDYAIQKKKVPVGGTSAGMSLLAGIDFKAQYNSPNPEHELINADDVLLNPTGSYIDLDRSVLTPPFMKDVITDTHFSERNRQGRLVGFMARAVYNKYDQVFYNNIKGIGADEGTATCFNESGIAHMYGVGQVYFLIGQSPVERLQTGHSLDWYGNQKAVLIYVINGASVNSELNSFFDLTTWKGSGGVTQSWWVDGSNELSPVLGRH